jgi:hypothetical protein
MGHEGQVDQVAYRFRDGDTAGLNANSDWSALQNTAISMQDGTDTDVTRRVRIELEETKSVAVTSGTQWRYQLNTGGWNDITTTSSVVKAVASAQYAEDDATSTSLLTGSARTHVNGYGTEDGASPTVSLNNQSTEHELAFQVVGTDVTGGDTVYIRIEGNVTAWTFEATINITSPVYTPTLGSYRWYENNAAEPTVALAAIDTKYTVTNDDMPTPSGVITPLRFRFQIVETGGVAGTLTLNLQYRTREPVAVALGDYQAFNTTANVAEQRQYLGWANGLGTAGNATTTFLVTGSDANGEYCEDDGNVISIGASETVEIDCSINVHWPTPDLDMDIRVLDGAAEVGVFTSVIASPTRSNRDSSLTGPFDLDGEGNLGSNRSYMPRGFHDGTRFWHFYTDWLSPGTIRYRSSLDGVVWSAEGTTTLSGTGAGDAGKFSVFGKDNAGTYTFVLVGGDAGSANSISIRKGTVSGASISWGAEETSPTHPASDTTKGCTISIDDGGYIWIAALTITTGVPWAMRSTNAWATNAWNSATSHPTEAVNLSWCDANGIICLGSNEALCIYTDGGPSYDLRSDRITGTTWDDSAAIVSSGATDIGGTNGEDWGWVRSGGYVYLGYTEDQATNTGPWGFDVYTESTQTWAAGTDPSVTRPVATASDGICLMADGDDIYMFDSTPQSDSDNTMHRYKKYTGPGTSGTWDTTPTYINDDYRNNSDFTAPMSLAGGYKILLFVERGDDDSVAGKMFVHHEVWGIDLPRPPQVFQRRKLTTVRM